MEGGERVTRDTIGLNYVFFRAKVPSFSVCSHCLREPLVVRITCRPECYFSFISCYCGREQGKVFGGIGNGQPQLPFTGEGHQRSKNKGHYLPPGDPVRQKAPAWGGVLERKNVMVLLALTKMNYTSGAKAHRKHWRSLAHKGRLCSKGQSQTTFP